MPEEFVIEQKILPTITVQSGNVDEAQAEIAQLPRGIGSVLGFRITGGSDFHMPITIFHVSLPLKILPYFYVNVGTARLMVSLKKLDINHFY